MRGDINSARGRIIPAARAGDKRWSRSRWGLLILLAFTAHFALIFALGERSMVVPRAPARVPLLRVAAESGDWLALDNPTLFALPQLQGFAGAAWLRFSQLRIQPERQIEQLHYLALPPQRLGEVFALFSKTNAAADFKQPLCPEPELAELEIPAQTDLPTQSILRIQGEIAHRKLLNPPELPSWPAESLLTTNSVVQALVDGAGSVINMPLLTTPSGSSEADQYALRNAANFRFEPLSSEFHGGADRAGNLVLVTMIFEWRATPAPGANE